MLLFNENDMSIQLEDESGSVPQLNRTNFHYRCPRHFNKEPAGNLIPAREAIFRKSGKAQNIQLKAMNQRTLQRQSDSMLLHIPQQQI